MNYKYVIIRDKKRTFTKKEKGSQLIKQSGCCDCCKEYIILDEAYGGHKLSWAKGNPTDAKINQVVLCYDCNSEQSDMDYDKFKELKENDK